MKTLLIQCLRGKSIGQINLNYINKEIFYYVCKLDDLPNDWENNINKVLILEYQKENNDMYCVGAAEGNVEETKKIDDNILIKMTNIKTNSIKYNNKIEIKDDYSKMRDAIKSDISSINEKIEFKQEKKYKIELLDIYSLNLYNTKECINEINKKNEKNNKPNEEYKNIMESIENLEKVGDLAQRSSYAKRVIGKGDIRENRTEFQRDWERIIHAKSFRRLEDKAQIYTLSKGDHFRTRLTHTLEVTQIARGIARELKLNEDLVEAIALGHDLGHTPFGHVGERTLNEVLQNEGVEGGFKHNFQGVKVVNYLEEKYGEFEGIDLTYQVMEGILKHTKVCDCEDKKLCSKRRKIKGLNCPKNNYKIESFLCNGNKEELHPDYSFATTLEGQAVAVADEIAQRAHDLDDGIASGIINEEQFLNELKEMAREEFYERLKKEVAKEIYDTIEVEKKSLDDIKKKYKKNKLVNIAKKKILKDLNEEQRNEFIHKEYFDINKVMDDIEENVKNQFFDAVEDELIAKYCSPNSIENILLDIHKGMNNYLKKTFIDRVKSDMKNKFVEAVEEFLKDKNDYFKFLLKDNKSKLVKEEKDKLKVELSKRLKNIIGKNLEKDILSDLVLGEDYELNILKKYEEIECNQKIEDSLIDKRNDAKLKFYEDIEKLLEFKYLVVLDDINKIIKTIDCYKKLDKEIQELLDKHINDIMNKSFIIKIKTENQMKKKALESKFEDELYNRIKKSLAYIKEDQRDYIDELDIKRARIVSDVITYFIDRIKNDSKYRIENYEKENLNNFKGKSWIINEELIKFSEKTDDVRVKLEKISSSRIINSEEVNCFDGKGNYVIRKIYNAYKTNPMQMSKTTLKRIYREVCQYTNYAIDITDITSCSRDDADKEIEIYNGKDNNDCIKKIKHKIFVRCLVDLIAGMTDDFANRQYDKLYSPRIY